MIKHIFIFTWDRYHTITTPQFFEACGLDYRVLIHNDDHAAKYFEAAKFPREKAIVTNVQKGLAHNRNWALDQIPDDEWSLFFVDDFVNMTELDEYDSFKEDKLPVDTTNSTYWGKKLKAEIDACTFMQRCEECTAKADAEGIKLVGFACFENPLFRAAKWKYNSLADGRALLIKKSALRFDINAQLIDDYAFTALNLKTFGKVILNQWILPNCKRYSDGGYGSKETRMVQKMAECKYLVETYPDFIAYADKKGWPDKSHITIRHRKQDFFTNNLNLNKLF